MSALVSSCAASSHCARVREIGAGVCVRPAEGPPRRSLPLRLLMITRDEGEGEGGRARLCSRYRTRQRSVQGVCMYCTVYKLGREVGGVGKGDRASHVVAVRRNVLCFFLRRWDLEEDREIGKGRALKDVTAPIAPLTTN